MKSKTKGKAIGICVIALLAVCCAAVGVYHLQNYDSCYYTQIDNSKMEELPVGSDMKCEYTLDCYSSKGKKRQLTFKTSRELREDAYLSLEVRSFGVHKWAEVEYNDMPSEVQEKLK